MISILARNYPSDQELPQEHGAVFGDSCKLFKIVIVNPKLFFSITEVGHNSTQKRKMKNI
jgi:hypothetical protein